MNEKRPFLRAAGLVGSITALSRLLGLARDMVLASCLGASRGADIFLIAFELPNLARRVLGEGSLSSFIVPIFTQVRSERGEGAAWRFAANALTTLALAALVLTIIGILAAGPLFSLFGFGYLERGDREALDLGARLTRIMFPFLTFLALSSILMGLCHSVRRFTTPALGSVMLNLSLIAAGLFFSGRSAGGFVQALAWAVVAGGALRLIIMVPTLARAGFRYRPVFAPATPEMSRLFSMMAPALFGLAVVQINISISRAFATLLGEGFVPCLIYSNRLVQLPLAVIAAALTTSLLPLLSQYRVENRHEEMKGLVLFSFRLVFILLLPAAAGLIALGEPIIAVLFGRGNWDAQGTAYTYWALIFYAPGLVVIGLMRILTAVYYAGQDVRTPVITATAATALTIFLNILLLSTPFLRQRLGHGGLALSTTLGAFLNTALLLAILRRRGIPLWSAEVTATALRALSAAAAMALMAWWVWRWLEPAAGGSQMMAAALLGGLIAVSAGFYFLLAFLMGTPDLREALRVALRRGK